MDYSVTELERRMANLIRVGTIAEADYDAARVRVRSGKQLSGWLPWMVQRAGPDRTWWAPEIGEQVLVFAPDGEPANGVVLGAIYQAAHPAPENRETIHSVHYQDGTRLSYDREAHHLTITAQGPITVVATGPVVVQAPQIRLN